MEQLTELGNTKSSITAPVLEIAKELITLLNKKIKPHDNVLALIRTFLAYGVTIKEGNADPRFNNAACTGKISFFAVPSQKEACLSRDEPNVEDEYYGIIRT